MSNFILYYRMTRIVFHSLFQLTEGPRECVLLALVQQESFAISAPSHGLLLKMPAGASYASVYSLSETHEACFSAHHIPQRVQKQF